MVVVVVTTAVVKGGLAGLGSAALSRGPAAGAGAASSANDLPAERDRRRSLAAHAGRERSRGAKAAFALDRRLGEQGAGGGRVGRLDDVELGGPQQEEQVELRRAGAFRAREKRDVGVAAPYPGGDSRRLGGARGLGGGPRLA